MCKSNSTKELIGKSTPNSLKLSITFLLKGVVLTLIVNGFNLAILLKSSSSKLVKYPSKFKINPSKLLIYSTFKLYSFGIEILSIKPSLSKSFLYLVKRLSKSSKSLSNSA